ncbi:bacteriocin-like protein [Chryseobacterium geocarposphaerae]|uniref:Uncharacterized protein n=1 Tax=Chryseobacterium geocarposphaerae TaxID=1416776 RepID=A0A2M9C2K1_9FLAO|nr:hypothetical protein [Chryseobacterium geocarposphaerae]PJJ64654.1 hypothetical protein CLV73_3019 [Chryseobacterium geocarposphaerae]
MKNLKKVSRADLSRITGGYRNPNSPEWLQCYRVGYCFSTTDKDDVNGIGVPNNYYDFTVPENATNIRVCGWSAIIPAPEGC